MSLSYRWPLPWGLLLAPGVHILLEQHESKGRHFFLNLLFLVPLLFHHLLQLEASQLHAPLALVVQDVRIRPLHQGSLQAPQFLLSLVVRPLTPAAPHQGQVALDVAVGAAAPGRRQPDPVVHGPVPGGHHRSWGGAGRYGSGPWPQTNHLPPPTSLLSCTPSSTPVLSHCISYCMLLLHPPGLRNSSSSCPHCFLSIKIVAQFSRPFPTNALPQTTTPFFLAPRFSFLHPTQRIDSIVFQISPHSPFALLPHR